MYNSYQSFRNPHAFGEWALAGLDRWQEGNIFRVKRGPNRSLAMVSEIFQTGDTKMGKKIPVGKNIPYRKNKFLMIENRPPPVRKQSSNQSTEEGHFLPISVVWSSP